MVTIKNIFLTEQSTQIKLMISVPIQDFLPHYPMALFNNIPEFGLSLMTHPGQRYVDDWTQLILMAGNIHLNPGPTAKYDTSGGISYRCTRCSRWVHVKYSATNIMGKERSMVLTEKWGVTYVPGWEGLPSGPSGR